MPNRFSASVSNLRRSISSAALAAYASPYTQAFVLQLLSLASAFFSNTVLIYSLGSATYGTFAILLAISSFLSTFALHGADISLLSTFTGPVPLSNRLFFLIPLAHFLAGLFLIVSLLAAAAILPIPHTALPDSSLLFFLCACLLMNHILSALLRALRRTSEAVAVQNTIRELAFLALIGSLAAFTASQHLTLFVAVILYLLSALIASSFGIGFILQSLNTVPSKHTLAAPALLRKSFSLRLLFSVWYYRTMFLAVNRLDIPFVGAFFGAEWAGIYAVINRCGELLTLAIAVGNIVYGPFFARTDVSNADKRNQLQAVRRPVLLLGSLLAIVTMTAGSYVLLSAPDNPSALHSILALAAAVMVRLAATSFGVPVIALQLLGAPNVAAKSITIGAILFLAFLVVAYYTHSLILTAVAPAASTFTVCCMCYTVARYSLASSSAKASLTTNKFQSAENVK